MTAHLHGIDHLLIGVADLDTAAATYRKLGFTTTPKGEHVGWGTANFCMMFPTDYLELIGIVDPSQFTNRLDTFLESGEGLLGIALATSGPNETRRAWQVAGLATSDVNMLKRRLLDPDGEIELAFKNVIINGEDCAGLRMFAVAAEDAPAMRRPEWLGHANGAIGIASVTIAAQAPMELAPTMGKVFGLSRLADTDNTLAVHTGRGVILVSNAEDLEMLHPEFESCTDRDEPWLAAMTLVVENISATAAYLDSQGIDYRWENSDVIGVPPSATHGVMLEFTHRRAFALG